MVVTEKSTRTYATLLRPSVIGIYGGDRSPSPLHIHNLGFAGYKENIRCSRSCRRHIFNNILSMSLPRPLTVCIISTLTNTAAVVRLYIHQATLSLLRAYKQCAKTSKVTMILPSSHRHRNGGGSVRTTESANTNRLSAYWRL